MEKKEKKEGNSERWLLTYSDLITLLLALFIILFAMSNVDKAKYTSFAHSASQAFAGVDLFEQNQQGIMDGNGNSVIDNNGGPTETTTLAETTSSSETTSADTPTTSSGEVPTNATLGGLADAISKEMGDNNLSDGVSVTLVGNTLTITLSNRAHFDSASADMNDYMKKVLTLMQPQLNSVKSSIFIRGYTDNIPTDGVTFKSNWQLSSMRAANVVQYLIDNCKVDATRLVAVGCGENYPKASNDTEEGRSKNRRIELSITYDK